MDGIIHGFHLSGLGAARPAPRRLPADLVHGDPCPGRAAARRPGHQPQEGDVVDDVAPGRGRGVRAMAMDIPGRENLLGTRLVVEVVGVPPRTDELPVAAAGGERRAGVADPLPFGRRGAVPVPSVREARRLRCDT